VRRKIKQKYKKLWPHFGIFFWQTCDKCGYEFVRESGWYAITGPIFKGHGRGRYLCKKCAPTLEIADDYFYNNEFIGKRPPPPPAPPKKRTIKESLS